MPELRSALSEHLGVPRECVAISAGATAALAATLLVHGKPDALVTPSPGYPGYEGLAESLGVTQFRYNLNSDENLEHVFSSVNGRPVAVWNSPHNPSGRVEGDSDIRMLNRLADRGMVTIEDRVYGDLKLPDHAVSRSIDAETNVIIGSLSKVLALAGERVGFIVADPKTLKAVARTAWRLSMSVSSSSQQVALQTLVDDDLHTQIHMRRRHRIDAYGIARSVLQLDDTPVADPYFVWMTFPGATTSAERITSACHERGVLVASGEAFGATVPAIRLSLTSVPLEDLKLALSVVRVTLAELGLVPGRFLQ